MIITRHSHQSKRLVSFFQSIATPWVVKAQEDVVASWGLGNMEVFFDKEGLKFFRCDWSEMHTLEGFYRELIEKVRLPDYMGKNLNALSECLVDVNVMGEGPFVLWVDNVESVTPEEKEGLEGFIETLQIAGKEWSLSVRVGEAWDRDAQAFHAVFSFSSLSEVPTAIRQLPDLLDCCGSIQSAQMDD